MIWLLGALGWLRKAVEALVSLVVRYPWQAALAASLCLSAWLWWGWDHSNGQRDLWHHALDLRVQAENTAAAAQIRLNNAHRALSRATAGEVQHDHVERGARADELADGFIRSNRVRACPSASGSSDPAAQDNPAAVPAGAAADPILVTVPAGDVKACTTAWNYAVSAHELAVKQVSAGLAEWGQ